MINVNEKVKRLVIDILNDIVIKEIPTGKNPMAVSLEHRYFISAVKSPNIILPNTISVKAAGITEVTLRNRFTELEKKKVLYFN